METAIRPDNSVRFENFELNLQTHELYRNGKRLKVRGHPVDVLAVLVEHPGELVTRDTLQKRIWPDHTFVDFEHSLNSAIGKLRDALGDRAEKPRFVETLPRLGYRFVAQAHNGASQQEPHSPVNSIAVLPLANLSLDPEQEYFADGMTEALICSLSGIHALRVVSRTTAMCFKQTSKSLPEIAEELDVDAVVEGTVSRYGGQVRITANLVHAPTDRHLWSGSYEADWKDILALQNRLARTVAEEVKGELTLEDHAQLASAPRRNPEAYDNYLKATYARKRSAGGLVAGIQHFRNAIAIDADYAEAYLGLALAYTQMGFGYGPLSPAEAMRESREAALSALRLDPRLIGAETCCAWARAFGDWDWLGADQDFRHAIASNSNCAEAHRLYAWYLSAMCRHDEAVSHAIRASELEPDSMSAAYAVGAANYWAHRYTELAAQIEKLEQMDPTFPGGMRLHGALCVYLGSKEEAIRQLEREVDLCGDNLDSFGLSCLGYAYGIAGRSTEARAVLNKLESAAEHTYISPFFIGLLYTGLGDIDRAFEWLERARHERNPMLAFIRVNPFHEPLHSDPRFNELVQAMNFPSASITMQR